MALTGGDIDVESLGRGFTVVSHEGWEATSMLTVHVSVLGETGWAVQPRQRVRVHLGTAEVLARVAVLEAEAEDGIGGGEAGWIQLRMETPVCARAGDLLVLRSYSPVTTIGGGVVVEASPPKRRSLRPEERSALERLREGSPRERLASLLLLAGDTGVPNHRLPALTGLTPGQVSEVLQSDSAGDVSSGSPRWSERQGIVFGGEVMERSVGTVVQAVEAHHRTRPLESGMPLEAIRALFTRGGGDVLAAAAIDRLVSEERLTVEGRFAREPGFAPKLDTRHEPIRDGLLSDYRTAGLTPPSNEEVAESASDPALTEQVLGYLVAEGTLVALDGEYRILAEVLEEAVRRIGAELGGRTGLGPADFREVLPVTRKHLLPILLYTDKAGITVRRVDGTRDVPGDQAGVQGRLPD
jgi:selenocysteine-specific elongation factor